MIEVGILKNFDSGTYKAGVQLAGSLTTYFDDISVAKNIPSSAMVIGNYVILAIPGGNPKDACVIATWPQGSPGGGAGTFLDLSDTPSSYSGQAGKIPQVKATEDALEFISGWEKIAEVILSSDVDYVDFTNLDIATDKFYILVLNIKNPGASCSYSLYRNTDYTETNYYLQYFICTGTTVAAARVNAAPIFGISATTNGGALIWIELDPSGYMRAKASSNRDAPPGVWYQDIALASNVVASNITSLRLKGDKANAIGIGSTLLLYKTGVTVCEG